MWFHLSRALKHLREQIVLFRSTSKRSGRNKYAVSRDEKIDDVQELPMDALLEEIKPSSSQQCERMLKVLVFRTEEA